MTDVLAGGGGIDLTGTCEQAVTKPLSPDEFPGNHIGAIVTYGELHHNGNQSWNYGNGSSLDGVRFWAAFSCYFVGLGELLRKADVNSKIIRVLQRCWKLLVCGRIVSGISAWLKTLHVRKALTRARTIDTSEISGQR